MTRTLPALALFVSLTVVISASGQPKKDLDQPATVAALKRLGGVSEGFTVTENGEIHLKTEKFDSTSDKLQVFRLTADDKLLAKLPKSEAGVGLDLHGTAVTDAGMKSVANLKGLQLISLSGTKIGDDGLKELFACKDLRVLDLSDTKVKSESLRQLDQFKELRALDLSKCKSVGDKSVRDLGLVKELRSLNLERTGVSDSGVRDLGPLKKLFTLNLTATKVTDGGMNDLAAALHGTGEPLPRSNRCRGRRSACSTRQTPVSSSASTCAPTRTGNGTLKELEGACRAAVSEPGRHARIDDEGGQAPWRLPLASLP